MQNSHVRKLSTLVLGFWFIAILLVSHVVAAEAPVSASISALATVAQPVGMLTSSDGSNSEYLLYCPKQGHVFCSMTFHEHVRQLSELPIESSWRMRHQTLLAGDVSAPVSLAALTSGMPDVPSACVMTLIYTEN